MNMQFRKLLHGIFFFFLRYSDNYQMHKGDSKISQALHVDLVDIIDDAM